MAGLSNRDCIDYTCPTRGSLETGRNRAKNIRVLTQSRDLYAKTGMPQRVEQVQAWLDALPQ